MNWFCYTSAILVVAISATSDIYLIKAGFSNEDNLQFHQTWAFQKLNYVNSSYFSENMWPNSPRHTFQLPGWMNLIRMDVFELFLKNLRPNFPNYLKMFVIFIIEFAYIFSKKLILFERMSIVIFKNILIKRFIMCQNDKQKFQDYSKSYCLFIIHM